MSSILDTVLPVFGLIALGFLAAKIQLVSVESAKGLAQFVFNVAIPAFLFRTMALLPTQAMAPWSLWLVFFGAIAIVWFVATLVARTVPQLATGGGSSAAMSASFGNLIMLGTPLAIAHYGEAAAVPAGFILSVHAAVLWFAATVHMELSRTGSHLSIVTLARDLLLGLARNAIVLSLVAGFLWRLTGWTVHPIPDRILELLSDTSVPAALFALGLSLAGYGLKGQWAAMAVLIVFKMLLLPVVVWLLVTYVVALPPIWAKVALLFAAIPTGANAFLFASRYNAALPAVSGAIAIGTGLSAISVTLLLYLTD